MRVERYIVITFIVIALSIAGYFGVRIYLFSQQEANRHQIVSTLYEIGNIAQQYYQKHPGQGGGGLSYANWVLPDKYRKTSSASFYFVAKRNKVYLSGIGTIPGRNGITNVRASAVVDSSGVRITIIN